MCSSAYDKEKINVGIVDLVGEFEQGFNPFTASTAYQDQVLSDLYDGLLTRSKLGKPVAALAERWEFSDDRKQITFYLRKDAKWSDGEPITAQNFRDGMKVLSAFEYKLVILDDHTLQFNLEKPTSILLDILSYYRHTAIPSHLVKKVGDDWSKPENLVSSGPYIVNFADSIEGKKLTLNQNKHYWNRDESYIPEVNYIKVEKEGDFVRKVIKEELDLVFELSAHQKNLLDKKLPGYIKLMPTQSACYIYINHQREILKNVNLRKALASAVNRQALINATDRPGLKPIITFIPNIQDFQSATTFSHNPDIAAKAIADAGYTKDNPAKLKFLSPSSVSSKRLVSYLRSAYAKYNIKLIPDFKKDWDENLRLFKAGDFDLGLYCWAPDRLYLSDFLGIAISTLADNHGKYNNPKVDDLWRKTLDIYNDEDKIPLLKEAESLVISEVAMVPLFRMSLISVVHPDILGYEDNLTIFHPVRWFRWKE